MLTGVSIVFFTNVDVVLAKHFLDSKDAGIYALTALIGKILFFFGSLASPFIMPLVSRSEGANRDSKAILNFTLVGTLILIFPAFIALGFFGSYFAPLLFGQNATHSVKFLLPITFSMMCFTLSRVYTEYYLAKKYFSFTFTAFVIAVIQLGVLVIFHKDLNSFVYVVSSTWTLYFVATFLLHIWSDKVLVFENNLNDFLNLFSRYKTVERNSKEKLRILIFNWRDTKHVWSGGAEVYIYELSKRWVKDGHFVTVFCGRDGHSSKNEIIDGIHIYRRGGFYTVYFWAVIYYIFKFKGNYDVIVDSENGIPFFTPLYAREKIFLLIHHVHQEVFRKSLNWPLSWIASNLEAKVMPIVYRNTEVITVSPSSKNEIIKHKLTTREPHIIYSGVDLKEFKSSKKSRFPTVLYLGRLKYYKSLNVFIKAANEVLEKIPEAVFIIAGEGEEGDNLKKYARSKGIEDKIHFLGKVTQVDKIKLYQQAWLFMNPSFMEGWGITAIEASACGTPVVASDVPGLRDSVRTGVNGFLAKYGNSHEFADKVFEVLNNGSLRSKLGKNAVAWASNFSWETSANKMLQILNTDL
ncbi:MAG: hypothetical protein COU81_00650 [Candidatus Portnoybacteria bacterium CG10_big_fil_rev_8_21_14_0_10_36_7]|uniref:Glycosyl transferase family 1 domain-containing protein n=1 Tax=Candidatus Portnoybacteria bacterium CG10_big_fil_rev_8_21_14_0_10_36_7 TaxID=1974812 RepID=A0A2M8KEW2_9BACT|nr:MAG: hypothetical protein COU81_00650 [Candidatus Portnoybacteria bacterium CG10_big_fil_rev_8_21_14_0_10_36_7]